MISNIDIEKALKNNTEHNISILKEIRWNIEKFYREAQTALHELLITYEVREDAYENPHPEFCGAMVNHVENNPESFPYKFIKALHAADRVIITYEEILVNFDSTGIPGSEDWSDDDILTYFYDFQSERERWIRRTRTVFDKAKNRFAEDILYE